MAHSSSVMSPLKFCLLPSYDSASDFKNMAIGILEMVNDFRQAVMRMLDYSVGGPKF